MRHLVRGRRLSRTSEHRRALRRNLVQSLIEHGKVRTTLVKAKETRAFAEKLVTLAIDGSLASRQRAIALLNDRAVIPKEHQDDYDRMSDAKRTKVIRSRSGRRYRASTTRPGVKFTAESVIHKLFHELGPRMKERNQRIRKRNEGDQPVGGGYTRIIKLPDRRLGDGGSVAILEWVGQEDQPRPKNTDKTERKRRASVKYTFFAGKKIRRGGGRRSGRPAKEEVPEPTEKAPAKDDVPEDTAPPGQAKTPAGGNKTAEE